MLIASWNLAKRNRDKEAILDHLEQLGVDIALLQESNLHQYAKERGWQVIPAPYEPADCVIIARAGYVVEAAEASALSQLGRYVAHARLRHHDRVIDLVSVHPLAKVVPRSELAHLPEIDVQRPDDPRVWYSDLYFYLLGHALSGRPAIIGGDWNTSRLFGNSLFDRAAAASWHEVLPDFNNGTQFRTWFRRTDRPHGLDHLFCLGTAIPAVLSGRVDTEVADSAADHEGRGLSDHALLLMEFDIEAVPAQHGETDAVPTSPAAIAAARYTDIATGTYNWVDGTQYDVVPSDGSVFIFGGGQAIHHRADCPYAARTAQVLTVEDPDRDLWQRLLDGRATARQLASPGREEESEKRIAKDLNLRNANGGLAWVCCVLCVLRPRPASGDALA